MLDTNIFANIKLLVLDVDGVLTKGALWYNFKGEEIKVFHAHDGYGMKTLLRNGIKIAIISGRKSEAVNTRMAELGIEHVYQGIEDKLPVLTTLLEKLGLNYEEVAYIGDDWPDYRCMEKVGLSIAVKNARKEVLELAKIITQTEGGCGAVREVCDLLLKANSQHKTTFY